MTLVNRSNPLQYDHEQTRQTLANFGAQLCRFIAQPFEPTYWALMKNHWQTFELDLIRHFIAEEQGLFPLINRYRCMTLLEVEHDDLIERLALVSKALNACGPPSGIPPVDTLKTTLVQAFEQFELQLNAHMLEEDRGIFPLMGSLLEPEEAQLAIRKVTEIEDQWGDTSDPDLLRGLLNRPIPQLRTGHLHEPLNQAKVRYETIHEAGKTTLHHIQLKAGQSLKRHWSPQYQWMLVLGGQLTVTTDTETMHFHSGDWVSLEPKLAMALLAETMCEMLMVKSWPADPPGST